jgi:hypothetical protein
LLSIVLGMRLCETGFDNPDFTHMQNYIWNVGLDTGV